MRLVVLLFLFFIASDVRAQSDWLQWGGPSRNFTTNSKGLASAWPSTGPKRLWSRPLGPGHSSILASGNTLYTMYNQGEQEGVIALAADTPVWGNDNLLFISSAYSGGSRVLKLTQKDGKTTADELWFHRRMRLHHGTAVRIGDYIYGSSGDFGPAFLAAVNVKTGEIAYQDRSFPKSNLLLAEGKLIILDEDGNLALATATPTELKVISKASVMKNLSWTAPTLVGTKLYLRDRHTIVALDLS